MSKQLLLPGEELAEMALADLPEPPGFIEITPGVFWCRMWAKATSSRKYHLMRERGGLCKATKNASNPKKMFWENARKLNCKLCIRDLGARCRWLVNHAMQTDDIKLNIESAGIARDHFEENGCQPAARLLDIWIYISEE